MARTRTALVVGAVMALCLLVGATVWPTTGHGAEPRDGGAPADVDGSDDFDGRLHANAETGCIELPPEEESSPDVVPVEPPLVPPRAGDDQEPARIDELLEGERMPALPGDLYLHAEPWPACDELAVTPVDGDAAPPPRRP